MPENLSVPLAGYPAVKFTGHHFLRRAECYQTIEPGGAPGPLADLALRRFEFHRGFTPFVSRSQKIYFSGGHEHIVLEIKILTRRFVLPSEFLKHIHENQ
jgi:hypothetical protein